MIHALYRALSIAGRPLIDRHLRARLGRGKEDKARFPERLGVPGAPRPGGPLVWLHAASVGESLSMLPLVERLCARPGLSLLMTTGTVTSARLMAERLPAGAIHQYMPVDVPAYVRRFLDHWRPDLALWAESEFWPNALGEAGRRGIPLVLVQGRVSPRSFAGWRKVAGFIREILSNFTLCLGQTEGDVARLKALGAGEARCLGNLKMAQPPLPCDEAELDRLRRTLAGRKVWLAASTHPGEEAIAGRVHRLVGDAHPGLLTIVAPRHPWRGPEIAAELAGMGLGVSSRSANGTLDCDVHLADTMGELGLFYRLSPIVFMGKSFTVEGGQNPFEPARLGAAVLFGPRMSNFPDMAPAMLEVGAAVEVADEAALAAEVGRLLSDSGDLERRRRAALAWAESGAGTLDAVLGALEPFLAEAERRHARP